MGQYTFSSILIATCTRFLVRLYSVIRPARKSRYNTKEDVEALSNIDPDYEKFLASDAEKSPVLLMSLKDFVGYWKASPVTPQLPDTETEFTVTAGMRDGHESEVRVYKPKQNSSSSSNTAINEKKTPLVVLIHGGGWCMGHWSHVGMYARAVASLHGVTAVSISYRQAPEHKFPQAPHDVWDTLVWLVGEEGLQALGGDVDPRKGFVVGGISAGGNLAAIAAEKSAHLARKGAADRLPCPITGAWLSIPVIYDDDNVPEKYSHLWLSRDQNSQGRVITRDDMDFLLESYQPEKFSPEYCPGSGSGSDAHVGMPRTLIQVAGQDPLRDDGLIYDKVLRDAGVSTRIHVYPGLPHGFSEVMELPVSLKSRADTLKGMAWLLGNKAVPSDEQCAEALRGAAEDAATLGA